MNKEALTLLSILSLHVVVTQHCPSLAVHPGVHEQNLAGAHGRSPGGQHDPAALVFHCLCVPSGGTRRGCCCWSHGHHVGKVRGCWILLYTLQLSVVQEELWPLLQDSHCSYKSRKQSAVIHATAPTYTVTTVFVPSFVSSFQSWSQDRTGQRFFFRTNCGNW